MHQQPQGESIWGTINTCVEIALNIYEITAKDKNGVERTGVMARRDTANLSPKAASMGTQDGDWLCYDENTKDIPIYETLQRRIEQCKKVESAALKQMEEIKRNGKVSLTDYFGKCAPPTESPQSEVSDALPICNGIYFTQDHENMKFAVHEVVADNFMTPIAASFGQKKGEYLFYELTSSAIALNELKDVFNETEALIVSEDSLYATLNRRFPIYVSAYNELVQQESRIPKVDAPDSLFLAVQLETAKNMTEETAQDGIYEPDFNEETGYEIEP